MCIISHKMTEFKRNLKILFPLGVHGNIAGQSSVIVIEAHNSRVHVNQCFETYFSQRSTNKIWYSAIGVNKILNIISHE